MTSKSPLCILNVIEPSSHPTTTKASSRWRAQETPGDNIRVQIRRPDKVAVEITEQLAGPARLGAADGSAAANEEAATGEPARSRAAKMPKKA